MFGGLMKALGAPLHMGGKMNPMNSSNKFINPANMLGGAGQKMGLAPPPQQNFQQQPAQGLGPSMQAIGDMTNKMGYGGMKPPSMGQEGRDMGVNMGQRPMNQPPPFMKPGMGGGYDGSGTGGYQPWKQQPPAMVAPIPQQSMQDGIGPSMGALGSMMQQQPQQGEAMQPQPDFMNQSQDRMKMY